jgi:hypothetical protein
MFPWLTLICAFSVACGNLRTPTGTYGSIFLFFASSHIKPNQGWGFFRGIQRLALCGLCVRFNPIKPYQAKSRSGPFSSTRFEL